METDLKSLAGIWAAGLSAAIESLTGSSMELQPPALAHAIEARGRDQWKQVLEAAGVKLALRIAAADTDWAALGGRILQAGPGETLPEADLRDAFMEALRQSSGQLARHLESSLGAEAQQSTLEQVTDEDGGAEWFAIRLRAADGWSVNLHVGIRCADAAPPPAPERRARAGRTGDPPRTLELLMEVELPVGVSFGRTQMRLKDAIKLTTGSIVELNRSVSEQVEVIVNNCVIARGEVVVVEGNYGVRIQEIVSPEERLRTLF